MSDPPNTPRTVLYENVALTIDAEKRAAAAEGKVTFLERELEIVRTENVNLTNRVATAEAGQRAAEAARDTAITRATGLENELRTLRADIDRAQQNPPRRQVLETERGGSNPLVWVIWLVILGFIALGLLLTQDRWVPWIQGFFNRPAVVAEGPDLSGLRSDVDGLKTTVAGHDRQLGILTTAAEMLPEQIRKDLEMNKTAILAAITAATMSLTPVLVNGDVTLAADLQPSLTCEDKGTVDTCEVDDILVASNVPEMCTLKATAVYADNSPYDAEDVSWRLVFHINGEVKTGDFPGQGGMNDLEFPCEMFAEANFMELCLLLDGTPGPSSVFDENWIRQHYQAIGSNGVINPSVPIRFQGNV